MSGLLRTIASRGALLPRGQTIIQRANLQTRPAKEKLGLVENVFALGLLTVAVLGPSGWILAHLEDYKKRE